MKTIKVFTAIVIGLVLGTLISIVYLGLICFVVARCLALELRDAVKRQWKKTF